MYVCMYVCMYVYMYVCKCMYVGMYVFMFFQIVHNHAIRPCHRSHSMPHALILTRACL